ncbi:hypothetical protein CK218_00920 [Mesorhizobium sp. WSM3879]|nr:hypothetical protein CK218_00920 [Mesorhizobium sp. WSM3879]
MPRRGEGAAGSFHQKSGPAGKRGMSLNGKRAPLIAVWNRLKPHQNGVWLAKQGGRKNRDFAPL